MPKPGPVVCAEAWSRSDVRPPVACRSPARSCAPKPCRRSRSEARPGAGNFPARPGPARPGPARHGPARPHGEVRSGLAGSNYDSLEETQWPCASFGQLSENRGKRLSPISLRGISFENREKRQSSTRRSVFSGVCRPRGVTTTLSRKPNGRARHFANFRKIEENLYKFYDCPHNHGHRGVYLHVSLSMLNY